MLVPHSTGNEDTRFITQTYIRYSMTNTDSIRRFIFDDTDMRGEIVTLHDSYQTAYANQQCPDILKPLFGQFLAGVTLLSDVLKFDGIITLQARGDGALPLIMAEATHSGSLRGIVKCDASFDDLTDDKQTLKSLKELIGHGVLAITIDPTQGARYQGIVPLDAPSLAECIGHYFHQSEQLPTSLSLFANSDHCGGLFLQCLPAQLIKDRDKRQDLWQTAQHLGATLKQNELFELSHTEVLTRLFHELSCRVFEPKAMKFECGCTFERSANALVSLGEKDAFALLEEVKTIKTQCHFCGQEYAFGTKELEDIFSAAGKHH